MSLRIRVPFLWPEKRLCCAFRCGDVAVPVVGELVVLSWDRSSINLHSEHLPNKHRDSQGYLCQICFKHGQTLAQCC